MAPLPLLRDPDAAVAWLRAQGATGLATDSRRVRPGDAFIAWPGYGVDARQFVPSAIKAGAVACLVEADGAEAFPLDGSVCAALPGLKGLAGELAHRFEGRPSERLQVFAVTGTNGKTSCAWWVAQALATLGRRCGVVGTLGIGEPPAVESTGLTTPDPVTLQAAFRRFAEAGVQACAIEASSIGIVEQRLAGTRVEVAMFTNFTRDHLDFHGGMAAYWDAKAQLFAWPGLRAAVVNVDDEQGAGLARRLDGALDLWTFSADANHAARLQARHVHYDADGLAFTLNEGPHTVAVRTALIGDYNASNVLAVIGALRAAGVPLVDAAAACTGLTPVPGRMQRVDGGEAGPEVVVDYAHTPDALEKALGALRPLADARGGRLWTVFGCGGNRDATKRPLMGAIAAERADHVIVTSDNPRHETPDDILRQIAAGMGVQASVTVIEDRRAAIDRAVMQAGPNDVVLVAGKGHEPAQEIAGVKHPFSDVAEAQAALRRRAAR